MPGTAGGHQPVHVRTTLVVVCTAGGLLPASLTGSSVAAVAVGADLQAGLAGLQWMVNGYNVAFAGLMLASGALADLIGRRRVFAGGLALFLLCSAIAAAAPGIVILDVARSASGLGAAAVLTAGSAILADAFEGPARMKAFGILGSSFGLGLAAGPSISGLLVDAWSWRAVFAAHAIVVALLLPALPRLRESRNPAAHSIDLPGTVTFTASLVCLTLAIVEGPQRGWTDGLVMGLAVLAVVCLVGFVLVERRPDTMFDLGLLTNRRFVAACLAPVLLAFGFVCLLVVLPPYFVGVRGAGPGSVGAVMLLLTGPVLVFPIVAGRLAQRVPASLLLAGGLVLVAAGAAGLTLLTPQRPLGALVLPLLVIGTGVGISFGLLDGLAISSVESARAGMAAGMFNTMRLASEAIAIAVMGSLLVTFTAARLGHRPAGLGWPAGSEALADRIAQGDLAGAAASVPSATRDAFVAMAGQAATGALHSVLWILAAICATGAPVIALLLRERSAARAGQAGAPPADADLVRTSG